MSVLRNLKSSRVATMWRHRQSEPDEGFHTLRPIVGPFWWDDLFMDLGAC